MFLLRITIELNDIERIQNCKDCPFGVYSGHICEPRKTLCSFRCNLLASLRIPHPNLVQSEKPVRPDFCPIVRVSNSKDKSSG